MKQLRSVILIVAMLILSMVSSATGQVSIGIGLPNVSIGINLPLFPELVRVPGYPVYYAPRLDANYFFYDSYYWVYQDDNWYASYWYNGPWWLVEPEVVPVFILRVPVRYYRQPPEYFRGWYSNAPPRWGRHWGHKWEQRRRGWDKWNRGSAPAPAPLPVYQRQYSGDRYPRIEEQKTLHRENYRYQPRDRMVRQHIQPRIEQRVPAPAQRGRQELPATRSHRQQESQPSAPLQQRGAVAPRPERQQRGDENMRRPAPVQPSPQQKGPAVREDKQPPRAINPEQHSPRPQRLEQRSPDRRGPQEFDQGHGQKRDEERGRERN